MTVRAQSPFVRLCETAERSVTRTVAELYRTIVDSFIDEEKIGHGRKGYYFGENGEHTLLSVGEEIGIVLDDLGLVKTAKPTMFTRHEIDKYLGGVSSFSIGEKQC